MDQLRGLRLPQERSGERDAEPGGDRLREDQGRGSDRLLGGGLRLSQLERVPGGEPGDVPEEVRGISETARGENVDLLDCYRRLAERGLVEYDPDLIIRWNNIEDRSRKVGRSSVLMRTIVMNPALDSEDLSEEALDYALYSQICHVSLGFGPTREDDAERYEAMLTRFPEKISIETELRRVGLLI